MMIKKFEQEDIVVARAVAKAKAKHSGRESDFGFRAKKNGTFTGVVTAKPNGKSKVTRYKK